MSKLVYNNGIEGNPSNANNETDGYFNGVATASTDINNDNTRTGWISGEHIDWSADPINKKWIRRDNSNLVPTVYNGAWSTISHGNNGSTEITGINHTINAGEAIRFHFNVTASPDCSNIETIGSQDYFWFRIQTESAGVWTTVGYVTRNSVGHNRQISSINDPINGWRRYGISFIKIPAGAYAWSGVRVQVKTEQMNVVLSDWSFDTRVIGA